MDLEGRKEKGKRVNFFFYLFSQNLCCFPRNRASSLRTTIRMVEGRKGKEEKKRNDVYFLFSQKHPDSMGQDFTK